MVRITALCAVLLMSGCQAPTAPTALAPVAVQGGAVAVLASLPVRAPGPLTGYTRSAFLPHGWADPDGNGCDARRDALARQAVPGTQTFAGAHHCVLTATIVDPYSGTMISSKGADADHVEPLAKAWEQGAAGLTLAQREALANDPTNLIATSATLNRSKGDKTMDQWKPPNRGEWCDYSVRTVTVKARYHLSVSQAEHDALASALAGCR